jgi:catechol 2,3-dioxygenase-like lactoylglutathione lyase family enzyme
MDWKLELVMVPVADMDRAKDFYTGKLGWKLISDFSAGEAFRIIQVLPPGSACAIAMTRNPEAAGSVQGLHLVVNDIEAARAELVSHGVAASELFHFADGAQLDGPHP